MQQVEATVAFIGIDDEFVIDGEHLRWAVLANAVNFDLDAPKIEAQQWDRALDALDHAGGKSRKEQLGRIESIRPTLDVGIERQFGILDLATLPCASLRLAVTLYSSIGARTHSFSGGIGGHWRQVYCANRLLAQRPRAACAGAVKALRELSIPAIAEIAPSTNAITIIRWQQLPRRPQWLLCISRLVCVMPCHDKLSKSLALAALQQGPSEADDRCCFDCVAGESVPGIFQNEAEPLEFIGFTQALRQCRGRDEWARPPARA